MIQDKNLTLVGKCLEGGGGNHDISMWTLPMKLTTSGGKDLLKKE